VTLVIFAFWSAIVWSEPELAVTHDNIGNLAAPAAASPFDNLFGGIKDAWTSLTTDGK
jgi:hypothetical protein